MKLGWLGIPALFLLSGCTPRALPLVPFPEPHAAARPPAGGDRGAVPEQRRQMPYSADKPVQVDSDRLQYSEQGRVTVFLGHVKMRQGQTKVEAPYLEVRSQDGQAYARQGVKVMDGEQGITVTAQELDYKETLENATARGNVHLVSQDQNGLPLRMRSERLDWNAKQKAVSAQGNVVVNYRSATATAENLKYQQDEEIVELQPSTTAGGRRPMIDQAGNTITGDRIELRLKTRTYTVTGSARADVLPGTLPTDKPQSEHKEKP